MTNEDIIDRRDYPPGVPCWIDTEQPDPDAAAEFYAGLFGWEFESMLPPGIEDRYLIGRLRGFDVAAIASPTPGVSGAPSWNTYVCVTDTDATAQRATGLGAEVVVAPTDVGPPNAVAGRWAALADPDGARFRLWQPGYRTGAQLVNAPQTWNSSDLTTGDTDRATSFYAAVFGWEADPVDFGGGDAAADAFMWRLPGYGDFLAIRVSRHQAPPLRPVGPARLQRRHRLDGRRPRRRAIALDRHVLGRRHGCDRRPCGRARRHGRVAPRGSRWRCRANGHAP